MFLYLSNPFTEIQGISVERDTQAVQFKKFLYNSTPRRRSPFLVAFNYGFSCATCCRCASRFGRSCSTCSSSACCSSSARCSSYACCSQPPQPVEVAEGPQEQLNEVPYSVFRFLVFSFVRVSFVGLLVFCLHTPYSYCHGVCRFLYICLFQKYLFAYAACRLWFTLASMSSI